MLISEQWLREWVNPKESIDSIAQMITNAGLEVESISTIGDLDSLIVVGFVQEIAQHPDADKLRCTKVNVGDEVLDVVCGAQNVDKGQKVVVAKSGAKLPDGLKIKSSKLRGQPSQGMICSLSELGLASESNGILVLDENAPVGMSIAQFLKTKDTVLEVDLTPNRGDCASYLGVAREVSALTQNQMDANLLKFYKAGNEVRQDAYPALKPEHDIQKSIKVSATDACHHYYGLAICGINQNAKSPQWLTDKLQKNNQSSIHPVVDILNFVMLETGQPLHAFDMDKIKGNIHVRYANSETKNDEKLTILGGQTLELKDNTLVICDEQGPIALAGIMGGEHSGVSDATQNIFLESALFEQSIMVGKARAYGLTTDAAYRYERGVDSALAKPALFRAASLILEICGGKVGPLCEKVVNPYVPKKAIVHLSQIYRLLGVELSKTDVESIFSRLGFEFVVNETSPLSWEVTAPTHRYDLKIEVDFIEEVGRIFGIDNIPVEPPLASIKMHPMPENTISLRRLKRNLVEAECMEVITYSFVSPNMQSCVAPSAPTKTLLNPITSTLSVMRTTMLCGLLESLAYNQKRQQTRIRLFESGLCFNLEGEHQDQLVQSNKIAALIYGPRYEKHWDVAKETPMVDFYDIKGMLEKLLSITQFEKDFEFRAQAVEGYHRGQCAALYKKDKLVGHIGAIHPSVLKALDIQGPVYAFEMELDALSHKKETRYEAISKFPSINRDLAFVIDSQLPVGDVITQVQKTAGKLLRSICVFDIYQGKGIPQGQKSVAVDLILQHTSRTLVDKEVDEIMQKIIDMLRDKFGAELRV